MPGVRVRTGPRQRLETPGNAVTLSKASGTSRKFSLVPKAKMQRTSPSFFTDSINWTFLALMSPLLACYLLPDSVTFTVGRANSSTSRREIALSFEQKKGTTIDDFSHNYTFIIISFRNSAPSFSFT
jgi:hypothetical protein